MNKIAIGCILALVGSLELAAAFAAPNFIRLWTGEYVTYGLEAKPWSLPLGAVSLALGVLLIALAWRKRRGHDLRTAEC